MQENKDFVVHQPVQHLDKELRHYHLLVDIDKVRDNQERRVVVVGKDEQAANDQAEGDMRFVGVLDRLKPAMVVVTLVDVALVVVMVLLVSPMMLF